MTDANGQSYIYDGENKQTKASNGGGTLGEYWYDGDGKRVKKVVPATGEVTVFVYDAAGKFVAEYSTIVESAEDAKVAYLTADHLGSPRINTDRDGNVTTRHDYHPYGEEIVTAQRTSHAEYTPDSVRKQFTGYERDSETELDFAQARMYAKSLGRFYSVDPTLGSIKPTNPQTLNRYVYALNNPLIFVDPDGLEALLVGSWDTLSKEQQRLFKTYVEKNYAEALKAGSVTAESLWNQSANAANSPPAPGAAAPEVKLLSQSQLTTFVGTTSLLEKKGVIGEVESIHTIKGDETPRSRYRIQGDLKNADASVKAIKKAFPKGIGGSGHDEYSNSNRERGFTGEPNGQASLKPKSTGIEIDVDYRCILCRGHTADDGSNSDIRADTGKESHYQRHIDRYGPTPALAPMAKKQ